MDTPKALYACCACGLVGLAILAHVLLAAPAAPLQPVPLPPSILDDGLPPDLIRLASPMPDEARKCDVPLPPESHWTTNHGESSVAVFAHTAAEGSHGRDAEEEEPYRWSYRMELTNTGHTTVQLMTRHLVLTTADGVAEERKGAGARGRLPVLAPGERFELSGAARLRTPLGALHGSLQLVRRLDGAMNRCLTPSLQIRWH